MPLDTTRINSLKELINLEEKRARLQADIAALDAKIGELQRGLFLGSAAAAVATVAAPKSSKAAADKAKPAKPAAAAPKASGQKLKTKEGKAGFGEVRDAIMTIMNNHVGQEVPAVKVAGLIGGLPATVHAWFHTNLKRFPMMEKTAPGTYRLNQAVAFPIPVTGVVGKPGKAPKTAKAPKAAKAPQAANTSGAGATRGRGGLSAAILPLLEAAGEQGAKVADIADQIGTTYRNVYVWVVTTGKRYPLEKVSKGVYRINPAAAAAAPAPAAPAPVEAVEAPAVEAPVVAEAPAPVEAPVVAEVAPAEAPAPEASPTV